jgi:asparagine synthase (glutamine-hydrolysing)
LSAVFDNVPRCNERPFIDAVLAQNNVRPHYLHVDERSPLDDLERILWHLDEAMTAGNMNIPWGLYAGASSQNGVRVILDGYDGDTTISHGTGYFRELADAKRWLTLVKEGRGYAKHFENLSAWNVISTTIEQHGLGPRTRKAVKLVRRVANKFRGLRHSGPSQLDDFLDHDFFVRVGFEEHRQTAQRKNGKRTGRTERYYHYKRLTEAGIQHTLELLDKVGGAFQVETRFPFWDKRLAEFCLALPAEQKLRNGWNRMVMRRAMDEILPREVQWRGGKLDISNGLNWGLWTFERERIEQVIEKNSAVLGNYIRVPVLRKACQRFLNQKATDLDMFAIWKSVSLALWLQQATVTK